MVVFKPDGKLHGNSVVSELLNELPDDTEGVGAASVTFVDKGDAGNLVALHLSVDSDGLRLDAGYRAKDENGTVKYTQGPLNFDGEVNVARGVDDVDLGSFPFAVGGCGGNGDAPFFLQFHGVHGGADAIFSFYIVDCMNPVSIKENALSQGGLPGVNMGADTYVSNILQVGLHCHVSFLKKRSRQHMTYP